jgi:endoglycosylceramidase
MGRLDRSRPTLLLLAMALVAGVVTAGASPPSAEAAAAARRPYRPHLQALHAEPDPVHGGRIVDESGRQVLLRGVNVNAHAEYWAGTDFPTTFPFTAEDADQLAAIGWNTVRLLVSWSRVEPRPGRYDERYLDQVEATVDLLASRGIYAIIDLHQDAWGPTLAAPDDVVCPKGTNPALGWDGAPGWATLDSGGVRCIPGEIRELNPDVLAAFNAFWQDKPGPGGVGIRTRYVRMLGHIAGRFARTESVAGYDVMNEPNAFTPEQQAALADLYAQSLTTIRAAERRRHGFEHLLFFEPSALWSATGEGPPPDFARDRDVVYSPHLYTGGFNGGPITADAFQVALDEAKLFGGAPVVTGEWGGGPDRAGPGGDGYFLAHQALQDDFRFGATLWTWRESCGDPHKARGVRNGEAPTVWGEFEVDCRTNTIVGPRNDLIADLTRAYPRAAPGVLTDTGYDPATRHLTAAGTDAPRHRTLVVFHPTAPDPDAITVTGLRHVRVRPGRGGTAYVTAQTTGGAWTIDVAGP